MPSRPDHHIRLSRRELDRLFAAFVEHLASRRPETRGTYERALREFVRWSALDGKVRFRSADIERYKRYLTVRKKLAPVSVSTYLTSVRRFCEYLVSRGILKENPAARVGGNERPRTHTRDALSAEEVDRLLASLTAEDERGKRDGAMIRLMIFCGLSEIELIHADVRDMKVLSGQTILMVQGKGHTAKDQVAFLPETSREAVAHYARPGDPLFASAGNRTRGERMTTRGIRDRVNASLERAGIRREGGKRVSPYSLRHTAATLLVRSGVTVEELQQRMRLGSRATAEYYFQKSEAP
jgi:integrase/recombinase XerC